MAQLKNPTRRGFLGFMAAAPIAAKGAAKETSMRLSGVGVGFKDVLYYGGNSSSVGWRDAEECAVEPVDDLRRLQAIFRSGIPEWLREKTRVETSNVDVLTPNIATLRSVSLSAKCQMQRDFQYRKGIRQIEDRVAGKVDAVSALRRKLEQETGFWF